MGFEVDFHAVGDESKSGDAITLRYGNLGGPRNEQVVVVIDGGFATDGRKIVDFVQARYKTDIVDVVLSTHPDNDHIGGLATVIRSLRVAALWMHKPWSHSNQLSMAKAANFSSLRLAEAVRKSLEGAAELESLAVAKGIPIMEPFTGVTARGGGFRVVGPSAAFYTTQVAGIKSEANLLSKTIAEMLRKAAEVAGRLVPETLAIETLTDLGDTSPQNETSVVSLLEWDGHRLLFTSDAGTKALGEAAVALNVSGVAAGTLSFFQIPHHGSRRNVGPTILNQLLGPKGATATLGYAFVSAAKDGAPKHPAKKVTNAMIRRGYQPFVTKGSNLWHHYNAPTRPDYTTAVAIQFFDLVDESDE